MGKLLLGVLAGLASAVSAVPAQAGVIYFQAGGRGVTTRRPTSSVPISNFDTINAGTFSGTAGYAGTSTVNSNTTPAPIRTPQFESTGNFAYVIGGGANPGVYTLNLPSPAQVFTFIVGSLNATNSLTLNFAGGGSQTFTGGQMLGGLNTASSAASQNGRITYDAQGIAGGAVIGAIFRSGANTAFEFDNIATAAPEPATWLSMILGFGLIGGALRRVRPSRKLALA